MSERAFCDIAVVMVTIDRSPSRNYLGETAGNLRRSGLRQGVILCNSGQRDEWAREILRELGISCIAPGKIDSEDDLALLSQGYWLIDSPFETGRTANRNVAQALSLGASQGKPWVLFLEDDIDVCDEFLDGVWLWLRDFANPRRRVMALGANYKFPLSGCATYPVDDFYGTQGFVLRAEDAVSLAEWLYTHEFSLNPDGSAYDIHMHHWAAVTYPGIKNFVAASPAMIQHIGRESVIRPRDTTHTFPSWPGRGWRYTPHVVLG